MRTIKVSGRQAEVVSLVAKGCSDKEIASRLGLSLGTVKTYLVRLYRDNGFHNRAEAVAACFEAQSVTRKLQRATGMRRASSDAATVGLASATKASRRRLSPQE